MFGQMLDGTTKVGRFAALYVLGVLFTGSAILAGFDYATGTAIPPLVSSIIGTSITFALTTLSYHQGATAGANQAPVSPVSTTTSTITTSAPSNAQVNIPTPLPVEITKQP